MSRLVLFLIPLTASAAHAQGKTLCLPLIAFLLTQQKVEVWNDTGPDCSTSSSNIHPQISSSSITLATTATIISPAPSPITTTQINTQTSCTESSTSPFTTTRISTQTSCTESTTSPVTTTQ